MAAKNAIHGFIANNARSFRTAHSDKTRVILLCKFDSRLFRIRAFDTKKRGVTGLVILPFISLFLTVFKGEPLQFQSFSNCNSSPLLLIYCRQHAIKSGFYSAEQLGQKSLELVLLQWRLFKIKIRKLLSISAYDASNIIESLNVS